MPGKKIMIKKKVKTLTYYYGNIIIVTTLQGIIQNNIM